MTKTQMLSLLAGVLATGCLSDATVEDAAARATPADADKAVAALESLHRTIMNIDIVLNQNEGAIVAATQQFPIGELELRDSGDLRDAQRLLDPFFGALIQAVRDHQLSASAELGLSADLLCALDGRTAEDPVFQQCKQAVAAVNVRAFLGVTDGGGFAVEFRYSGPDGAVKTPIAIALDANGARASIDLGQTMEGIDMLVKLLAGGLGLDLGVKVSDLAHISGKITTEFKANAQGISFFVDVVEPINVRGPDGLGAFFLMEKNAAGPFLSLRLGADSSVAIDVNIGRISAEAPVGALQLDKQFTGTARVNWAGLTYHADGRNTDALNFRADVGELAIDNVTPQETTRIYGLKITSGQVRGTAEGNHSRSRTHLWEAPHLLSGFQTHFDTAVTLESTHLGRFSRRTISQGARVIDFRMSALGKAEALAILVATQRELAKVNSLQCVVNGTMSVIASNIGASQADQTLQVGDGQTDACIVGYYTKDDGVAHYNYGTTDRP